MDSVSLSSLLRRRILSCYVNLFIHILVHISSAAVQGLKQPSSPLIFANSKDIRMVHLDSPRIESTIIVANTGDASALDFYYKEQIVFWSDKATEKIQGYRLSSSSKKTFDVVSSRLSAPEGLAVDWLTKKLYWTDSETKRIEVALFDGRYRKVLFWKDLDMLRAIALVPQESLVFWTDWGDRPKIERASMDGKHRQILVEDDVRWPNGLAVDFEARRIYWVDGKLKYISSVDYNGLNRRKLTSNLPHVFGLTMEKDMFFMTDWTNMGISSCNKGTEKCKLLLPSSKPQSNQLYPMGIRVFSSSLQPDNVTNCDTNNGGCSHLCLLSTDPPYYSCACPTGILLSEDGKSCAKGEEKFIILLRKTDIRKISLDTEDHSDVVLDYKGIKYAVAVDNDPVEGHIYWTDDDVKAIRRAYLNSSQWENVISTDLIHPDGIAVDWIARNLYWTDTGSNTIQVSLLNGSYRKTLISTELDEPRAIVINPWKGLMFWTDWGADPKIERASLDGSARLKIVFKDLGWPNGLTIDLEDERLFWGDAKIHRIESCDFNGNSRKLLLDKVLHPFGITVLDDFVYWTDWRERTIYRTDKRQGGRKEVLIDQLPDMMGLKAMSIHQDLGLDPDLGCYRLNGGCKHLCLDRYQKPYTCACANGWELESDGKSCKRIKTTTPIPKIDRRLPTPPIPMLMKKPCPANQIACKSGDVDCFDVSHQCDGDYDCSDNSDEINCSSCPEDKIMCSSNPNLCFELSIICEKYSTCPDVGEDIIKLCLKRRTSSPSTGYPIFSGTNGLPLVGAFLAIAIVIIIFYWACKTGTNSLDKEQPFSMPLMPPSLPFNPSGPDVRPLPMLNQASVSTPPPPDLLISYSNLDHSRVETSSLYENESNSRLYPLNPPPSPATIISRNSFFPPSAHSVSSMTEDSLASSRLAAIHQHSKHRRKKDFTTDSEANYPNIYSDGSSEYF